jgi:hypothetical protein
MAGLQRVRQQEGVVSAVPLATAIHHPSLKILADVLANLPRESFAIDEGPLLISGDVEYVVEVTPSHARAASIVVFAMPGHGATLLVGRRSNRLELLAKTSVYTSLDAEDELRQMLVAIVSGRIRDVVRTRRRSDRVVSVRTELDLESGQTIAETAIEMIWPWPRTTTVETYSHYADDPFDRAEERGSDDSAALRRSG